MGKKHKTPRTPSVRVTPRQAARVLEGHPWIFDNEVTQTRGHMPLATLVKVIDEHDTILGHGLYSQSSKIRVRMLSPQFPLPGAEGAPLLASHFEAALLACLTRRVALGFVEDVAAAKQPSNAARYRLVNSEGDGVPGLIVDVLGELIVVQITTAPLHALRDEVFTALAAIFPEHALLDIPAPDGIMELEGFHVERQWRSERRPDRVVLKEGEVRFGLVTEEFQKTGHYADMRPHREWIGARSKGRRVLDAYAYTGGFGLHAALGGASEVVSVDSSSAAANRASENATLNEIEGMNVVVSKVDRYLDEAISREESFDVTILDPPKLAPNKRTAHRALKVYESLCVQGIAVTKPGGMFCITSCSEAIGERELLKILARCAASSQRSIFVVYTGAQAPDHPWPAAMSEGRYATFLAAMVS